MKSPFSHLGLSTGSSQESSYTTVSMMFCLIARFLLGGVFVFSALAKIWDQDPSLRVMAALGIEAETRIGIELFVIVTELLLGICILAGFRLKQASWISIVLLFFFTIAVGFAFAKGVTGDCGCFGGAIPSTLGG